MAEDPTLEFSKEHLQKIEYVEEELKSAARIINTMVHVMDDLTSRIGVVERKTYSLSEMPTRVNCRHCGKIVSNPRVSNCPHCRKPL